MDGVPGFFQGRQEREPGWAGASFSILCPFLDSQKSLLELCGSAVRRRRSRVPRSGPRGHQLCTAGSLLFPLWQVEADDDVAAPIGMCDAYLCRGLDGIGIESPAPSAHLLGAF